MLWMSRPMFVVQSTFFYVDFVLLLFLEVGFALLI